MVATKKCNKKRFHSKELAEQFIEKHPHMEAYFCSQCTYWHITSGIVGRINKAKTGNKGATIEWMKRKQRRRR